MNNLICIVAGEPNSVNSELIAKVWKKRKNLKKINIVVIGNYLLIKRQLKIIGLRLALKKISSLENINIKNKLLILNVPLKFKNPFNVDAISKSIYIKNCFNIAIKLTKKKKISGFINCAINKKETFGNNFTGITEFLAKKEKVLGKEAMIIYNRKLSVCPITTHVKVKKISKLLSKKLILNKLITVNQFFIKKLKFKPKIGLLGLNPHNDEFRRESEEKKIIIPVIKFLKKKRMSVQGPLSADTAFINHKKHKFDIIVGMYHDQVLSPFKALFKFNAINLTAGLPYIRISPDHGTGKDIIKKNIANPKSLFESKKFFQKINVKS